MKVKLTNLCLGLLLLTGFGVQAQESSEQDMRTPVDSAARSKYYISAHIATQGVGLELKYAPTPAFAVRGGASILPVKGDFVYSVGTQPTSVDFDVDFGNAHVMFDWHPFLAETSLSRKIVVTAGAGYFWKAEGDAVVSYKGTYKYGDILIPSDDLGQLTGTVEWNNVAPYLGFGFDHVFPRNKFNVGFAIGTYYLGKPDVTLTGSKMLAYNSENEAQFRENMSHYRFMPVLQINFNFAL
ncbi:hypothetical protein [Pedobacter deserti]|uniref:hypothetical protein n=1 Tax=Pedobacter deserti TaxID=2817382 RepID=UPI00210C2774|nr:hypothetical protein [Pedobacter sp. SYSU D00382]